MVSEAAMVAAFLKAEFCSPRFSGDLVITRQELGNLRYVDYSYWNELTDHTRLVRDGVKNIRQGKLVFDVPHDGFWAVTERVLNGAQAFEPIILWGRDGDSPLEILEGHLRATAFGLAGDKAPAAIKVLVGLMSAPGASPRAASRA